MIEPIQPGQNLDKPIYEIEHYLLEPINYPNCWASVCPVCEEGTLGVRRDMKTLVFQEIDICTLCGQRVKYTDIDNMRSKDWAGNAKNTKNRVE